MLTVSVLIPTHNRAAILSQALESLRQVECPPGSRVELIVVANACTDRTVQVVEEFAARLPFAVRCVVEHEIGLDAARNRAVREARGEILAFLDDDVWCEPKWLAALVRVFAEYPCDLVGGKVVLWWQAVARPEWAGRRVEHLLNCVDHGRKVIELTTPGAIVGANFAFRRAVVERIGLFPKEFDRKGASLLGGGDTDFFARALAGGFRMFYAPEVCVRHWVAPHRISLQYLNAVAFCNGLTRVFLRPRFPWSLALKVVLEHGVRIGVYGVLERVAQVLGQRRSYMNHHIRRRTSMGNVAGAWLRIRGLSPLAGTGDTAGGGAGIRSDAGVGSRREAETAELAEGALVKVGA